MTATEALKPFWNAFSSPGSCRLAIACYTAYPIISAAIADLYTSNQLTNVDHTTSPLSKYVFTRINACPAILSVFTLAITTYGLYKNSSHSLDVAGLLAQLTILSIGGSIIGQVIARNKTRT